jgi:S1-C subfamily serine protease
MRVVIAGTVVMLLAACQSAPVSTGHSPTVRTGTPVPANADSSTLEDQFVNVVKQVGPSVVVIQTSSGLGSGVVFDSQGDIVTNAHVVGSANSFQVTSSDGKVHSAALVGTFPPDDLAVVRAQGSALHSASFGDSSKLVVGDIVMAIGNPLGLQSSVTEGIVSALGRTVNEPGGTALPGVIQTSAPINPGNSGGALVNLVGQVIGIPTLTATDPQIGGAAPGIGFAIPSNMARDIASQLIQYGHVVNSHRAYLGIETGDTGGSGVFVANVVSGGPADRAGIRSGDLILSINGHDTSDTNSLTSVLANLKPGDTVSVKIEHEDGSQGTVRVTLGTFPGQ